MNVILLPKQAFLADGTAMMTSPKQVYHIKNVLKASVGDVLKIAQLSHRLGTARIERICSDGIVLTDISLKTMPPPKLDLTLVLALPRPKVLRRLMMDMTAMGVRQIVLVNSYRTDKSYWQSPLLAQLEDFIWQGLEQAVDCVPPVVRLEKRFKPFVEDSLQALGQNIVVAHPYADGSFNAVQALPDVLVVGAEGGFIPYEIDLLIYYGATALSLGQRILRTEAAVNALLGRWLV